MADEQAPNPAPGRDKAKDERTDGRGETGITNRPLDEEEANQEAVPERGERKGDSHA